MLMPDGKKLDGKTRMPTSSAHTCTHYKLSFDTHIGQQKNE